jgi:hypothetical protein
VAHNNKTPANVLTAPKQVIKAIVAHTPIRIKEKRPDGTTTEKWTGGYKHQGDNVDPLTGVYRNPDRVARKARAKAKRARRSRGNKKGGNKK